jgi:hypothetical protein
VSTSVSLGYSDFEHMLSEQDLKALHGDPRFEQLVLDVRERATAVAQKIIRFAGEGKRGTSASCFRLKFGPPDNSSVKVGNAQLIGSPFGLRLEVHGLAGGLLSVIDRCLGSRLLARN